MDIGVYITNIRYVIERLKVEQFATREKAIRREDAVMQLETAVKVLEKIQTDGDKEYIRTNKSRRELEFVFRALVEKEYIVPKESALAAVSVSGEDLLHMNTQKAYNIMLNQFLAIFDSDPSTKQGRAVWGKKYRNRPCNSSLVDFLLIAGVEKRNIKHIAKVLFYTDLSESTISSFAGYAKKDSVFHEELRRIWNGTHSE